jgi:hypothetical protein
MTINSIFDTVYGDKCLWWSRPSRDVSGDSPSDESDRLDALTEVTKFEAFATLTTGPEKHVFVKTPAGRCLITVSSLPEAMGVVIFDSLPAGTACRKRFWMNASSITSIGVKLRESRDKQADWDSLFLEADEKVVETTSVHLLTKTQERQIDFLRKCESREELDPQPTYEITCNTCKADITCHAACTGIDFIRKHSGHSTWVQNLGKTRYQGR